MTSPTAVPQVNASRQLLLNTTGMLMIAFMASGYVSIAVEGVLYCFAALGLPLTPTMLNALQAPSLLGSKRSLV